MLLLVQNPLNSVPFEQVIEQKQTNIQNLSFSDIKDVVDTKGNNIEVKKVNVDLIKDDIQLKALKLEREMHESTFLRMYKTRSATLYDLNMLRTDIYKTQEQLQDRLVAETDPDKQLHINNELFMLKNLLEMVDELAKRIIEAQKLSEENNKILSSTDSLRKYLEGSFNIPSGYEKLMLNYIGCTNKGAINEFVIHH